MPYHETDCMHDYEFYAVSSGIARGRGRGHGPKPQQVNFLRVTKIPKIPNLLPLDVFFQDVYTPKLFSAGRTPGLDPAVGAYDASRPPSHLLVYLCPVQHGRSISMPDS